MKTIKIILASSAELKTDRDELRIFISVENDRLHHLGFYLELVQWEYFLDAISDTRLQEEYNKVLEQCDIVLSLFFTKAGKFTQEEIERAYAHFKARGRPLIFTYFKTAPVDMDTLDTQVLSLIKFKERLWEIGHFPTYYKSIEDLKYKFKIQLEKLFATGALEEQAQGSYEVVDSSKGVHIIGDKIKRQINLGNGSTYIEKTRKLNALSPAEPIEKTTKILFLAASPEDKARLQVEKEYNTIKAALERGKSRDTFEFLPPQFGVTAAELVRAVNSKPQIIHFSGHGRHDGLFLSNSNGQCQMMPLSALNRLFKPLAGFTTLVLLSACYSGNQAQEISRFGMYVVGNNSKIADQALIAFAEGLYIGLGEGKPFEDAYNDAMIVLITHNAADDTAMVVWKDGAQLDL